ncbi:MAG: hypothetical protein Q4C34_01045 [Bacteroidales bacterium]|nr:hypothetical protein [Bacteroidales bacterium]
MTLTDKFSTERLIMLWRYYTPGMTRQLWLTAALTLLCYLISLGATFLPESLGLYTFASFVLMFGYYCGPLHFARFRDRNFSLQLPATAAERTLFMLFFTMIVVPAVMVVTWYASVGIASLFTANAPITTVMLARVDADAAQSGVNLGQFSDVMCLQRVQDVIPMLVCLLCVTSSRRTPVTNGIIGVIVSLVAMSMIGGIIGLTIGFTAGLHDALNGNTIDTDAFVSKLTSMMIYTVYLICVLAILTFIYTAVRLYRTFRHQQS